MPAFGRDLGIPALAGDGFARRQDRTGRLDREADDHILPGGDAAQHAARGIGLEFDVLAFHPHFVGIVFARQRGGAETGADFHALDRVDAHHRGGEVRVELAVNRRAETGRHAGGHDFDHRADGRALLAHGVEIGFPFFCGRRVRTPERVLCYIGPTPPVAVDFHLAHLHHGAADPDPATQDFPRHRARRHPAGGFPRRRPAAAAIVADAVFFPIGVIRMAGAELVLDVAVILRSRILVADHQAERGAGGLALEHARHDFDRVRFLALGHEAGRARLALVQPCLDVGFAQLQPGRHAVQHAADGRAVAFAPRGDAEQMPEAVIGHWVGPLVPRVAAPARSPSRPPTG